MPKAFAKIMIIPAFIVAACFSAAPALSAELTTDWRQVTHTGLSGVAVAVLEKPEGGYIAYWMGGGKGMCAATSPDGIVWALAQGFSMPPMGPDQAMQSNPWVFITQDGRFRMIYEVQYWDRNRRLFSAISQDGLSFSEEGMVMAGGEEDVPWPPNPKEGEIVFLSVPAGIRLSDGSLRMYFVSAGDRIRSAVSFDDGLTWQRDQGVRMPNGVDPSVTALPDGGFRLFYVDWSDEFRTRKAWFADSSDGLDFVTQGPIAWTDGLDGVLVDPELMILPDGSLQMLFSFGTWEDISIYRAAPPEGWSRKAFPMVKPETAE